MCLALSKNFSTLCAIRFLVGLAESTFFPGIQVSPIAEIPFLVTAVMKTGNDVKPPGVVRHRKLVQEGGACKESLLIPCESTSNFVCVIAKGLTLADG